MSDRHRSVARRMPWVAIALSPLVIAGLWDTTNRFLLVVVVVLIDTFVALLELATIRKWGGFLGEKRPDGRPRYR